MNLRCRLIIVAWLSLSRHDGNVASAEPHHEPSEAWVGSELNKVFARETGLQLTPLETKAGLERLSLFYTNLASPKESSAHMTYLRQSRLRRLLEASEVSDGNCKRAHFVKLQQVLSDNREFRLNIEPYLAHFKVAQFKLCKPVLERQVMQLVQSQLPDREELQPLLGQLTVAMDARGHHMLPRQALGPPLGAYMLSRLGPVSARQLDPARFTVHFDIMIGQPCAWLYQRLSGLLFMLEAELASLVAPEPRQWLDNVKACRLLIEDRHELLDVAHTALLAAANKRQPRLGCLPRWLRPS